MVDDYVGIDPSDHGHARRLRAHCVGARAAEQLATYPRVAQEPPLKPYAN